MVLGRFETLDALRGLAALLVVFRHTTAFGSAAPDSHSYLAVDLFFVLSGFVIAHAYEKALFDGAMSRGRFVAVRLIRLYPLFLLSVVFAAAVALAVPPLAPAGGPPPGPAEPDTEQVLGNSALALLFLPSFLGDSPLLFPMNTALWSLMYELVVNLIYGALCVRLSTRSLCLIVAGCGIATAFFVLRRDGMDWGWSWGAGSLVSGLLRAGFGFGLGVLLRRGVERWPVSLPGIPPTLVMGVATLPLLVPNLPRGNGLIDLVAVFVVFPLAILLGARARPTGWLLRVSVLLGTASYPVYVLHVPGLRLLERALQALGSTEAGPDMVHAVAGGAFLVVLVAVALALDRWYDRPLRQALMARLRRAGHAGATA